MLSFYVDVGCASARGLVTIEPQARPGGERSGPGLAEHGGILVVLRRVSRSQVPYTLRKLVDAVDSPDYARNATHNPTGAYMDSFLTFVATHWDTVAALASAAVTYYLPSPKQKRQVK